MILGNYSVFIVLWKCSAGSTSVSCCRQALFFSFSWSVNICDVDLYMFWLLAELSCVTYTSKNAFTKQDQKPLVLMSTLESWPVLCLLTSKLVSHYHVVEVEALIPHYYNKSLTHFGLSGFSLDSYLYFHQVLPTHAIFIRDLQK